MSKLQSRWPVISFLDLFVCAVGAATIVLVLISLDVSTATPTARMLVAQVELQLPSGSTPPSAALARPDGSGGVGSRPGDDAARGMWAAVGDGAGRRSVFVLCDGAARPGEYTLVVRPGIPLEQAPDDPSLSELLRAGARQTHLNFAQRFAALCGPTADAALKHLATPGPSADLAKLTADWVEATRYVSENPADGPGVPKATAALRKAFRPARSTPAGNWNDRPLAQQLAIASVLMTVIEGPGNVAAVDVSGAVPTAGPSTVSEAEAAALWRDISWYLARYQGWLDPVRKSISPTRPPAPVAGGAAAQGFGAFLKPPRPILNPGDIGPAARRAAKAAPADDDGVTRLGPLWYEVAQDLMRPREIRVRVNWGSVEFERTVRPQEPRTGGAEVEYAFRIDVSTDPPSVNGEPMDARGPGPTTARAGAAGAGGQP